MPRTVLVVDDEPLILVLTATMLEELGCEVVTAGGGKSALSKLAANRRIDVLFTDIQMPEMDGYELAEKALRERPELQVIVCSGRVTAENDLPLLRKPFSQEDLAQVMLRTTGTGCQ